MSYFFKITIVRKNQDRSSRAIPKGFIFTLATPMTATVAQAMGLYEQEGAVAAIARSRTALATGKMRLALAGAETLGGCGGGGVGMEVMVVGGFLYTSSEEIRYMIYPCVPCPQQLCFRTE